MSFADSQRRQVEGAVPPISEDPTVPAHLQNLLDLLEPRLVLRAADWGWAETYLTPYEDGMLLHVVDEGSIHLRIDGVWTKLYPTTFVGSADPDPSFGSDGDTYFQTVS
jgi:hypothetical protein